MADIESCPKLCRQSVVEAASRVAGHIHRTPLLSSRFIDSAASTPQTPEALRGTEWEGRSPANPRLHLLFKCENFQRVGAFKPRGAFNALLRYKEEKAKQQETGDGVSKPAVIDGIYQSTNSNGLPVRIISHSSGNHAQAVALASGELGYPAHIVMPSVSTIAKIAATQGYGAKIHFSGPTPQQRLQIVDQLMGDPAFDNVFIPPYDHPDTMIGQGTLGLEIQEQAPGKLHGIMAPCGGGGMLSGVALSCQGTGIDVFGAEPSFEGADDCRRGLLQGKRIEVVKSTTIADGLRTPVGAIPWTVISDPSNVKGVFAANDDQIKKATKLVWERMKILIEPSSAVPLAVALYNEDFRSLVEKDQASSNCVYNLALVVSGGNIDLSEVSKITQA